MNARSNIKTLEECFGYQITSFNKLKVHIAWYAFTRAGFIVSAILVLNNITSRSVVPLVSLTIKIVNEQYMQSALAKNRAISTDSTVVICLRPVL